MAFTADEILKTLVRTHDLLVKSRGYDNANSRLHDEALICFIRIRVQADLFFLASGDGRFGEEAIDKLLNERTTVTGGC